MITLDQARRALRLWESEYIGQDQAKLWRSCVAEVASRDAIKLGKLDPARPVRHNGEPVRIVGYRVERQGIWPARWNVDLDGDGQGEHWNVRNVGEGDAD